MFEQALQFVEKMIHQTRKSIGFAEQKPNASRDEIDNLYRKLEILEYISQLVLAAKGD
jgi:hypothetical protein